MRHRASFSRSLAGKLAKGGQVCQLCFVILGEGPAISPGSTCVRNKGGSMRVAQFLTEQQVAFETIIHPPAFTAQKRAKFLHVPGKQVAKAVLLAGPKDYFLAVLPATHHVDTRTLSTALRKPVRLATSRELENV